MIPMLLGPQTTITTPSGSSASSGSCSSSKSSDEDVPVSVSVPSAIATIQGGSPEVKSRIDRLMTGVAWLRENSREARIERAMEEYKASEESYPVEMIGESNLRESMIARRIDTEIECEKQCKYQRRPTGSLHPLIKLQLILSPKSLLSFRLLLIQSLLFRESLLSVRGRHRFKVNTVLGGNFGRSLLWEVSLWCIIEHYTRNEYEHVGAHCMKECKAGQKMTIQLHRNKYKAGSTKMSSCNFQQKKYSLFTQHFFCLKVTA